MSRKRISDDDDIQAASSSPRKRTRHDIPPVPQTPVPFTSPSRRSCATPHTPYTPYPLSASDSPSNPFGSKRKERLAHSLPPVTSFSKHLALRFQFVRSGLGPRMGGIYRTVRVPANYNFMHLRSLIAWLFDTPARHAASADDYLFEVKGKVAMYSPLYKPGQIKSGVTTVKVSNVRDPARWQSGYGLGYDLEEDELFSQEDGYDTASQIEDEEWDWMDEEDFTVGHVWPKGLDPLIGLIYHHSPTTQVHITLNATKLPRQRGYSNTPFVFNARGRVYLSPLPLPRPLFSRENLPTSSPSAPLADSLRSRLMDRMASTHANPRQELQLTDAGADQDEDEDGDQDLHDFSSSHPFFQSPRKHPPPPAKRSVILVEDSDDEVDYSTEDFDAQPVLTRWNEPAHAFAMYLLQFTDPFGLAYDDADASFFADSTAYDPFDNDDDDDIPTRPKVGAVPPVEDDMYEDYDDEDDEDEDLAQSERDDEAGEDAEYNDYEAHPQEDFLLSTSTPDLVHRSSSLPASSPPPPQRDSSPDPFPFSGEPSIVLEEHYPNKKYTHTPAPPRARTHRLRLGRIERRMARTKRAAFLTKYDEVEEEAVDELQEEAVGGEEEEEEEEEDEGREDVRWTKPVLKEGEVWDPFGDEVEI